MFRWTVLALIGLACAGQAAPRSTAPPAEPTIPVTSTQPTPPPAENEPDSRPSSASFPRNASSPPEGPCTGDSGEVRRLLSERAAEARFCYERALRHNPKLMARVRVNVRVDAHGDPWASLAPNDALEDVEMKECIVLLFTRPLGAAPEGGCMDAIVPINFVAKPKAP